jgi:hypothetical protein
MNSSSSHFPTPGARWSRRQAIQRAGAGFGLLALAGLFSEAGLVVPSSLAGAMPAANPLGPHPPHFPAKAKAVIWLFINGGPSQVDTWDYKPELEKRNGVKLDNFDKFTGFFANEVGPLMKSPFEFKQHGQSGTWASELFPHLSKQVDKMAFIHSLYTESNNHSPALFMMNTGMTRMGFPCVGSWVTYGLGTENQNLPAFCVMSDPRGRGLPKGSAQNWGAGFLPGVYQGTYLRPHGDPIDNLKRPAAMTDAAQRAQIDLLADLNRDALRQNADDDLNARIESFELAYRMQMQAPDALDLAKEPASVKELYGVDRKECGHFAVQCLMARRLVERGVRFIQIYSGGMENQLSWDGHSDIQGNHKGFAAETDQPIAGLLEDLAARGLLDSTLVVWGGEFGRLPISQPGAKPGRDHNPHTNTVWMAGGGVKAGVHHGASDEIGYKAVVDRVSVNDFHATLLRLLGFDHERLTYRYSGRDFRLTDVAGKVVNAVIA